MNTTEQAAGRPRRIGVLVAVASAALAADAISKAVVVALLQNRPPVVLLGGLLKLRVLRNSGAAFNIGTGMTIVFTVIAAGVVVAILRYARRLRSLPWAVALGLLLGGALGNLADRLLRAPAPLQGHVVDWIELPHWPVFNLADSAIVCGGALAVLLASRGLQVDGTVYRDGAKPAGGAAAGDASAATARDAAAGERPGHTTARPGGRPGDGAQSGSGTGSSGTGSGAASAAGPAAHASATGGAGDDDAGAGTGGTAGAAAPANGSRPKAGTPGSAAGGPAPGDPESGDSHSGDPESGGGAPEGGGAASGAAGVSGTGVSGTGGTGQPAVDAPVGGQAASGGRAAAPRDVPQAGSVRDAGH